MFTRDRHSRWEKSGGYVYTRFIFFGPEVWEPATYQFKAWFGDDYYDGSKVLSESEFEQLMHQQREMPQLICCHARRVYYWWFADDVWTTLTRYNDAETVRRILGEQRETHRSGQSRANAKPVVPVSSRRVDPWKVLEITPGSSADVIKDAYYKQLSLYHPDKVAHLGPELQILASEKAKAINQAYEELLRGA